MATVEQFRYWQEEGAWHALTCGNGHGVLTVEAADVAGGVVLTCPACTYRQVPAPYLHRMAETMREYTETMRQGHKNATNGSE